ncbi:hypothetical protein [Terricaulis sp.]|uniref:helix-turn-helix transcriptional regulator n=1 Tax=Terricaulis sp. TaxID=2768686 RepID=UPI002AC474EB|nr:hypothetical protein [Terricaulis sp.]MDZ4690060.1 hypothetical protein [Terricaulis sp.]
MNAVRSPDPMSAAHAALQAAALNPDLWPQACETVGRVLGGTTFALLRIDDDGPAMITPPGHERHLETYISGAWGERDLRAARSLTAAPMTLICDDDIVDPLERQTSDFYRGFAAAEDVPFTLGWSFEETGRRYFFTSMRSAAQGPASTADRATLSALMATATAAARISCALRHERHVGVMAGLEAVGDAALALDERGRLVAHTTAAAPLLARYFTTQSGVLAGRQPAADAALGRVRRRLQKPDEEKALTSFVVSDEANTGLLCVPLLNTGPSRDVFADVAALLLLRDLNAQRRDTPPLLTKLFGLTTAESEVAYAIASGLSIAEVSHRRGVTPATTRTLLSAAFRKTGVNRQGALAALVAGLS